MFFRIVLFISYLGGYAMAEVPFYNQNVLDAFKKEIQYEKRLKSLPEDKFVLVDWKSTLNQFTDSEGVTWLSTRMSTFEAHLYGRLSATLKSDLGTIKVVVHSIQEGQKSAIEFALREAATTSMSYVDMKYYDSCFSDFCLVGTNPRVVDYTMFIFGNIFVQLDFYNEYNKDLLPVARYIQSVMEEAVADNPEKKLPGRPQFNYTVNQTKIKSKSSFTLTVGPGVGYSRELWDFGVAEELMNSEHIEYDEELGSDVYKFSAKKSGQGTIAFSLMDRKTLHIFSDTITVDIE